MDSAAPNILEKPQVFMEPAGAEALRAAYEKAAIILEYGAGGSTVMAAEMPAKTIYSIESDPAWIAHLQRWFAQNPPHSMPELVHVDIGRTKEWGYPVNNRGWQRFARYPLGIWERLKDSPPDVVLVDGRFRLGCVLAVALHTCKPVDLYFDDYANRRGYHIIEEFVGAPLGMHGGLAHFVIAPQKINPDALLTIINWMQRP